MAKKVAEKKTKLADIGVVGLAVMGENLILNMESKGFTVACYNRTVSKVDDFTSGRAAGKNIIGAHSVEELVASLKRPRKVMMMVKAGAAVDAFIEQVIPCLERATSSSTAAIRISRTRHGARPIARARGCSISAPASPVARKAR